MIRSRLMFLSIIWPSSTSTTGSPSSTERSERTLKFSQLSPTVSAAITEITVIASVTE